MKIALIMPHGQLHRKSGIFRRSLRYAPLTLTTLAALVPPELDVDIRIIDEGVEDWNPDTVEVDLVGLTCITGTSHRAYEIAGRFRSRSIPVVIGGVHATLIPEEVQRHADVVVTGYAELTWPQLLRDFSHGCMRPRYDQSPDFVFAGFPEPRRDLLDSRRYITMNTVQATRGCPWRCSFCVVPTAWPGYLKRPIPEVIAEVERLPGRQFLFLDLSPTEDPVYIKALYRALIPLRKEWGGLATMGIARDPEMLSLAAQSGCRGLLLGIESINPKTIRNMGKAVLNTPAEYLADIRRLHDHGIAINGCMVLGLDGDDTSVFEKTLEFVLKAGIDLPRFAVPTPFPNTTLYRQLKAQDRLLHEDWRFYDAQHVVFRPSDITPEALQEGLYWLWEQTYRLPHIFQRLKNSRASTPWTLVRTMIPLNVAYRFFARYLPEFGMVSCEEPVQPSATLPRTETQPLEEE